MQCSDRHTRRLLKKNRENYLEKLKNANDDAQIECTNQTEQNIEQNFDEIDVHVEETDETIESETLIKDLGKWQIKSGTSHKNMRELLGILRSHDINVPLSPLSLVQKVNTKVNVVAVEPGHYAHFGIEKTLRKIEHLLVDLDEIVCDINIDGLPIFKSSNVQLWPILLKLINVNHVRVFPAGIYIGKHKPNDVNDFFKNFIDEVSYLKQHHLSIKGKLVKFSIRAVICDAPAKAFVCGIAHHSSSSGCSKCTQIAKKNKNVLTYSPKIAEIITDDDFAKRKYKNQHQTRFQQCETPLEKINVNMISQVPLDPMHLIDLGVTRKILNKLYKNKVNNKISNIKKVNITKLLISLKKNITNDFKRLPRGLDELANWKATEFRQFLLYTGVVVLKDNVDDDFYYMFLLLHCATRLLSCPKNFKNNIQTAENLLKLFVENFTLVFGEQGITYNVHGLLHICACVRKLGVLYNFSAYDFENHLQLLKKDVRKPTDILQQLYNRNVYYNLIKEAKTLGIKEKNGTILSFTSAEYSFSKTPPNNLCLIMPYTPIKIESFRKCSNNKVKVIGRRFKNVRPFFVEPLDSLSALGVSIVDNEQEEIEETFTTDDINCKLLSLPYQNKLILLPILHGCI